MEFLMAAAAVLVVCVIIVTIKNLWISIRWRFGFRFNLDESLAHIAAKECANNMVAAAKQSGFMGRNPTEQACENLLADMYGFARLVIEEYVYRLSVPTIDLTSNPPCIREAMEAMSRSGESLPPDTGCQPGAPA
ncbi:MAG: hypothetical protein K8U57_27295 [Planctomycetes bacterium]|nr:hypothetical protein [Planctomycetota bacterium]